MAPTGRLPIILAGWEAGLEGAGIAYLFAPEISQEEEGIVEHIRRRRGACMAGAGATLLLALCMGACAKGSASGGTGADLHFVPEEGTLCQHDESRMLFTVRNGGDTPTGQQVNILVEYGSGFFPPDNSPNTLGRVFLGACPPPLDPGDEFVCRIPIPPGCFNPDCSFSVTIDHNDLVDESNEQNNTRHGTCVG